MGEGSGRYRLPLILLFDGDDFPFHPEVLRLSCHGHMELIQILEEVCLVMEFALNQFYIKLKNRSRK